MMNDYEKIEKVILFLQQHFTKQPDLQEIAKQAYLSPFHFQRLFKEWAGVSPKKFVQFLSVEYAKHLLNQNLTLSETSYQLGLSGTSRLHDLFIGIEGMTPGEFKNGGEGLIIRYSFGKSPFGEVIIASTNKGICHLAFIKEQSIGINNLINLFPKAHFIKKDDAIQTDALHFFNNDWNDIKQIKLHLKGTPFQLKVWQSLLQIPFGKLTTYGQIASDIKQENAFRAVGTAIGSNPIAYLIPCHRVIKSSGIIGEYRWGGFLKKAIIGWEAAKVSIE